ncbi:MAG: hypothetical protein IKR94_04700 [Bacteroidales bacterium]|nr:hypothetical protein [Bacteroidales bacterium]
MKKHFSIISIAALMLCACGSANQNNNATKANDNGKDSVPTVSTPTQTEPYDLAFYNLKGNVKKMNNAIEFSKSGVITSVDGYNPFELEEPQRSYNEETGDFTDLEKWTRDGKGRIISQRAWEYEQIYVWEGSQIIRDTTYCEGQVWLTTYEYDKDDLLVKNTTVMCEDNGKFEFEPCGIIEFTYKDFDSHNNWTKCITKKNDQVTNEVFEDEVTRTIEYW